MEEVARAVPEFLWLDNVVDVPLGVDPMKPTFSIAGKAANLTAVTVFISNLEDSPFIGAVRYGGAEQVVENEKTVFAFVVEADYAVPQPDAITVEPVLTVDGGA